MLEAFWVFKQTFCFTKIKDRFSKTVIKNYFLELFSKTVTKLTLIFSSFGFACKEFK